MARQLDAAFAARSDVMGYSEVVFFRFAAVLFFARSLLRNERAFSGKMIPTDSWAARRTRGACAAGWCDGSLRSFRRDHESSGLAFERVVDFLSRGGLN